MADDGKRLMHAHVHVNGASLMLHDEFPEYVGPADVDSGPPAGVTLHLQVDDADAWFDRAVAAGGARGDAAVGHVLGRPLRPGDGPVRLPLVDRCNCERSRTMSYVDGLVIPVKTADKAAFVEHARTTDKFFIDHGALRVVDCWGHDVPAGRVTDFARAVQATDDETVVFSWIEWPDKATRDAAFKAMEGNAEMTALPMPFDGKRMIFGGFEPVYVMEK